MSEKKRLDKQIESLSTQIKALPEGKLICARNGKHYKWYKSDGKVPIYLPKNKKFLAEQLARKKYLTLLLEDAVHEKQALEFYLRHHLQNTGKAQQLLTELPEYQTLLSPYFIPKAQEQLNWMNSPYEYNKKYPEQLTHRTVSGHFVRSKSELLIDMTLYTHKIPFRYECALTLGDSVVFPDFTILHPETGELFYWEHFGKMDDSTYCKNFCSKLHLYTTNQIIPGIQLITTFETKQHPLSIETIENTIQTYFG